MMGDDITVLESDDAGNLSVTEDSGTPTAELHCGHGDLLGPLGLFVQGLLAFIAFASLIGSFSIYIYV